MDPSAVLPPGPGESVWTQLWRYVPRPGEFLERCRRDHGDRFTVRLAGFGTFVMLARPSAVLEVFRGDPTALHSGEANRFLAAIVGSRSVLVLDEAAHADQRRALVPALHGERMRAHVDSMRRATEESIANWPRGAPFPLEPRLREITLRTILEVVLGIGGRAADDPAPARTERLRRDIGLLLAYSRVPFAIVLAQITPHRLLKRLSFLPYYRELRRIDATLRELLRERRDHRVAGDDVVADLLRARRTDGTMADVEELRDAVMTLLLAGHDTTAVALAWVFEQVLERPAVHAALRAELGRVVGEEGVRAEQLPRLAYLDAVVHEALRIRTVVPFVTRRVMRPLRVDGHDYPAGVHICPCSHLVHRDPDLYPEPESFRAERFLERRFGPHEWFPFGGGDRLCTGMAFALTQMKVVIATVLSRVDLRRPAGARSRVVRRGVLMAPSDGVQVEVAGTS
ncbi:MAG: cytochrome P450 [Planctomycetes bacterium]|nr:cytochrome P450 [Planctomycetota bacterium]